MGGTGVNGLNTHLAVNRTHQLKDNVKSHVNMYGLPKRIVSRTLLGIFQP